MAILDAHTIECVSHSEEQTDRLGGRLGALVGGGVVIALTGPLGAGKTLFARGFGAGWGAEQALRSPTFTLIQHHRRPTDSVALYHVDLYRATGPADIGTLGLDEILDDPNATCLIEWAERAGDLIPSTAINIALDITSATKRSLIFSTKSEQTWPLLLEFRKKTFGV